MISLNAYYNDLYRGKYSRCAFVMITIYICNNSKYWGEMSFYIFTSFIQINIGRMKLLATHVHQQIFVFVLWIKTRWLK